MKRLVIEHGALQVGVRSSGPFEHYWGGIFSGCTSDNADHAVSVLGFGTEYGVDYLLIKNSGVQIGENRATLG